MRKQFPIILGLLLGVLTACAPTEFDQSATQAEIVLPENNAVFLMGEQITIVTSVKHPAGAQSVALFANGELAREDELSASIYSGNILQGWIPPSSGSFQMQVLFTSPQGAELLSDTIEIHVGTEYAEANIAIIDLITPEPEVIVSPTPTTTAPTVTGNQDTNCRRGPSTNYQNIGTLFESHSAPIVGRMADNSWWVIDLEVTTEDCWVWSQLVSVNGDTSGVPIYTPPALPLVSPIQVTPDEDISCSSLAEVTFEWEPVSGASSYEYQIQSANAPDGPFSGYASGETSGTEANEDVICGSSIYYRWRVMALNATSDGPWSDWSVFKAGF
jgi:uncharacterized protein YraI